MKGYTLRDAPHGSILVCDRCGSAVLHASDHDEWHAEQDRQFRIVAAALGNAQ